MAPISGTLGINNNGTGTLQQYLGTSLKDAKSICCLPSINMWAKYKPERTTTGQASIDGKYADLTDTDRSRNNYGIDLGRKTSATAVMTAIDAGEYIWAYKRLVEDAQCYGRLTDFDGYDKAATNPFGLAHPVTVSVLQSSSTGNPTTIRIDLSILTPEGGLSAYNVALTDLHPSYGSTSTSVMDCYMCVEIRESVSGVVKGTYKASATIAAGGKRIDVDCSQWLMMYYDVYVYLQLGNTANYIPIHNVGKQQVQLLGGLTVNGRAYWTEDGHIEARFTIGSGNQAYSFAAADWIATLYESDTTTPVGGTKYLHNAAWTLPIGSYDTTTVSWTYGIDINKNYTVKLAYRGVEKLSLQLLKPMPPESV